MKIPWALDILLEHMHKELEINQIKIKCGCQSGRKVVTHNSKSDLPLDSSKVLCLAPVDAHVPHNAGILYPWGPICKSR